MVLFSDILFAMSWVHSQRKCILTEDCLHSPVVKSEGQSAYCGMGSASFTGIRHNLQGVKERFLWVFLTVEHSPGTLAIDGSVHDIYSYPKCIVDIMTRVQYRSRYTCILFRSPTALPGA